MGPVGDPIDIEWVKKAHPELTEEEATAFFDHLKSVLVCMYTDLYYRPHGHVLYVDFFNRPIQENETFQYRKSTYAVLKKLRTKRPNEYGVYEWLVCSHCELRMLPERAPDIGEFHTCGAQIVDEL